MHLLHDHTRRLHDRLPWIRCTVAVGPGWHSLAAEVLEAIASLTQQYDAEVFVDEIYEKFGTLRLRASSENEAVQAALNRIEDEAGARSLTICDVCGARGCLRKDGWIRVRCDAHAAFAPNET